MSYVFRENKLERKQNIEQLLVNKCPMETAINLQETQPEIKRRDHVVLLVPILLWDYVDRDPIEYKFKKLKSLYLLDIISSMMAKLHLHKKDMVCLSSEFLRKKYGTFYNFYIDYLLDEGLLILEKQHISGKRSKMYRLNSNLTSQYKHYKCYDESFIKKTEKAQEHRTKKCEVKSPIAEEIRRSLKEDLYHITLDIDGAKEYLDGLLKNGEIDKTKYNANLNTIEDISAGNIFTSFDDYGRMHTNFTILKKQIRNNFLKIDGFNIAELDIKNSQPSLLISILKENLDKLDKKEYDRYVKLCLEGNLYQKLQSVSNNQLTLSSSKKLVFKVLFGKNSNKDRENKFFKFCFPTILRFIKEYKRSAGTYKALAHELQRRESDLIYGKIVKEIKEKWPGIKMFTVHDSIIYPKYFEDRVPKIFDKRIREEFGSLSSELE